MFIQVCSITDHNGVEFYTKNTYRLHEFENEGIKLITCVWIGMEVTIPGTNNNVFIEVLMYNFDVNKVKVILKLRASRNRKYNIYKFDFFKNKCYGYGFKEYLELEFEPGKYADMLLYSKLAELDSIGDKRIYNIIQENSLESWNIFARYETMNGTRPLFPANIYSKISIDEFIVTCDSCKWVYNLAHLKQCIRGVDRCSHALDNWKYTIQETTKYLLHRKVISYESPLCI